MKAIGLTTYGGPDALQVLDVPEPHVGPGEVRIRVRAAAVNPVDAIIRSGGFAGKDGSIADPVVPGMDVSGVIDEVGPGRPSDIDVSIGDAAIGFVVPENSHGGYSEYVVLPSESVTRMPAGLDFVHAASFLSNALTAEITLEHFALTPGAALAVTGATGAVGGYLVELAARRGLTVIAAATGNDEPLVREFGATHVIDRRADFSDGVLALTGGRGADALADAAILTDQVTRAVRDGGQIAFYLPTDVDPGRGIDVFGSYVMRSNLRHDAIAMLARLAGSGAVSKRVAAVLPAAQAADAHVRLARGGLRGRLVLEF
ncbi:NADP-dependent oxidoreductase [Rathayibacter festucae]|uniref:NADP-dependent oxidoreductase n=1 Tax=Rathayibacter festucae TaxID=110937 RepID=UPI000FDAA162|nr:NADP-dependent oxidoreductase [Rathayibacter festucae]